MKRFFVSIIFGFLALTAQGMASNNSLIENVLEYAIKSSKTVEIVHEDGLKRRQCESEQLQKLISFIHKEAQNTETDFEKISQTILSSFQKDREDFKILSERLKKYPPGTNSSTYQLISNKMLLGNELACKTFDDDPSPFYCICAGSLPDGYSIEPPITNIFPNEDHIYSTKRGISLKHLLLRMVLYFKNSSNLFDLQDIIDIKNSPFVHLTPLPEGIDVQNILTNPYIIQKENKWYLAVIHNGYAFGGQRFETMHRDLGPEDCSTFISRYYDLNPTTTTTDSYLAYQIEKGFHFDILGGDVSKTWKEETYRDHFNNGIINWHQEKLKPVVVQYPSQIQPGWVSAERRFPAYNSNPFIVQKGNGGHISVVLGAMGQDQEMKLWTLGTNRDIEGQDMDFSYGIQSRRVFGDPLIQNENGYTVDSNVPLVMYFEQR